MIESEYLTGKVLLRKYTVQWENLRRGRSGKLWAILLTCTGDVPDEIN